LSSVISASNGRSLLFTYLTALTVPSQKMGPVSLRATRDSFCG